MSAKPPGNEFENPYLDPADITPEGTDILMGGLGYDTAGLRVNNWIDHEPGDYRFKNRRRTTPVTEIVVHETVTCNQMSTLRVLQPPSKSNPGGRDLGVHFIVEHDGVVYQNGDALDDMTFHASQHNGPSIGIEVVNPYEPRFRKADGPWQKTIHAPWAAGGQYVVPTQESAEALKKLLEFFTTAREGMPDRLQVPLRWVGLKDGRMALGRVAGAEKLSPGIYAHMYFEHADGSWLLLYAWLRMVAGLGPNQAYDEAVSRAMNAASVGADVADLLPNA
jgi:hypothetical protein